MKKTWSVVACLISIFLLSADLSGDNGKLTQRAAQALQSGYSIDSHRLWLIFDSTQVASSPIVLSDKALRRRAKVDPHNCLINEYDFSVSDEVRREIEATGVTIRQSSRWFKAISVEATPSQAEQLSRIAGLKSIDLVGQIRASRDIEIRKSHDELRQVIPPDDYGPSLAQNQYTNVIRLHDGGYSGAGALIAILDSGFNPDHPAFNSTSIVATWDFVNNREDVSGPDCPLDPVSWRQDHHGTLVFGAVGGYVPGELIGTAFGADFALAKSEITCGNNETKIEEDNWVAAAEWADSVGADIISSSLGYYFFNDTTDYSQSQLDGNTARVTIGADIAASKNILVATAAGNERNNSWGTIIFPADGDSVLAVGATNIYDSAATFTSPGPSADGRIKPDIVSLGIGVRTAESSGLGYTNASGTSLSTPLVAGGAALALEHDPTMTANELLNLIRSTGSQAGSPDYLLGFGIYDAAASADIVHVNSPGVVDVEVDETRTVPITTSGRSLLTPDIGLVDMPTGVTLDDYGNGNGLLTIIGLAENMHPIEIGLTADIGWYTDTTYFTLYTYGKILVGPNPFTDSVSFYRQIPSTTQGSRFVVSIFNTSGEKVWESVNKPAFSTDVKVWWDGRNDYGKTVAPGVYLVHIETDRETRRLKLLKLDQARRR